MSVAIEDKLSAAGLRTVLTQEGFHARKVLDEDLAERQFTLHHPGNERVELVVVINVANIFYKDAKYDGVSIFTMVDGYPLNVPEHPLNIVVGLSQIHDGEIFRQIVRGIAERFRNLHVDDEVAFRYIRP